MLEVVGPGNGKIVDLNNKIEKAFLRVEQGNEPHDRFVIICRGKLERKLFLDFRGFMPLHSREEYYGLSVNIIQNKGCREPIKAWHDVEQDRDNLLDGYLRLDICIENGIQLPEVVFVDLPNRNAAYEYVIDQQLNRRNLGIWWAAYFRGLKYNSEKLAPHRPSKNAKAPQTEGETAQRIAKKAGVSRATVERNSKFAECIDQLKNDLGAEFGKKILNRKFRRLSLEDVKTLAEKSIEDKKAIANALQENPKLSLEEAEDSIKPEEPDPANTSNTTDDTTEPANASSDDTNESISPQSSLANFKKRQEANLEVLYGIEKVEDTSIIPNMIKTEVAIIDKLKELQAPQAAGA